MSEFAKTGNERVRENQGQPPAIAAGVYHPIIELSLARFREFLRQPEAIFWTFGFPVLLTLALGIAFRNTGPEKILVGVEDSGAASAALARTLSAAPDMKVSLVSPEDAAQQLRSGKIAIVVKLDSQSAIAYRYDPTRPESSAARMAVDDAIERARGRNDLFAAHDEKVTESGSRYVDFLVPGLLGLNMMGSGMWGLGFAVVEMRSKRLLKRLAATPMRRTHFLLSFILSRLAFLWLELVIVIGFAWIFFGVKVRGSWLDLGIVAVAGAFSFSALGMLVASRARTIEGISGIMNLVMMPMWLLSGTFFSSARFPDFAQPFIKILPLTALNDALRSIITDGASLAANALNIGILAAWCVTSFVIAVRIFRWQ